MPRGQMLAELRRHQQKSVADYEVSPHLPPFLAMGTTRPGRPCTSGTLQDHAPQRTGTRAGAAQPLLGLDKPCQTGYGRATRDNTQETSPTLHALRALRAAL
jgi:hypothetical protein